MTPHTFFVYLLWKAWLILNDLPLGNTNRPIDTTSTTLIYELYGSEEISHTHTEQARDKSRAIDDRHHVPKVQLLVH